MRTPFVVEVAEVIELVLQVVQGVGAGLLGEPLLQGLVEALDLALGLGMVALRISTGDSPRPGINVR